MIIVNKTEELKKTFADLLNEAKKSLTEKDYDECIKTTTELTDFIKYVNDSLGNVNKMATIAMAAKENEVKGTNFGNELDEIAKIIGVDIQITPQPQLKPAAQAKPKASAPEEVADKVGTPAVQVAAPNPAQEVKPVIDPVEIPNPKNGFGLKKWFKEMMIPSKEKDEDEEVN